MNAFDNQRLVGVDLELIGGRVLFLIGKVKDGHISLLAFQQALDGIMEFSRSKASIASRSGVPVFFQGHFTSVAVKIVKADKHGPKTIDTQLNTHGGWQRWFYSDEDGPAINTVREPLRQISSAMSLRDLS